MKLTDIAKIIADHAGLPYSWEDISYRLKKGRPLPYKLTEKGIKTEGQKLVEICDRMMGHDLKPGQPCSHPGCCSHITHPCEGCGRTGCQ